MRYDNWDVILFPKDSAVPIQEFRTACYTTHDEHNRQLPTLTCYIASLPTAAPFRISIHSWTSPAKPSSLVESRRKNSEKVVFATQVIVDGTSVFHDFHEATSRWPQEIAYKKRSAGDPQQPINQRGALLEFPPFHHDVLTQPSWDARHHNGRIKVLLSEQLIGKNGDMEGTDLGIANDLVCFAFQHAPLDILEQAGISWPIRNPLYLAADIRGPQMSQLSGPYTAADDFQPELRTGSVSMQHSPSMFVRPRDSSAFARPRTETASHVFHLPKFSLGRKARRPGLWGSSFEDSFSGSYEDFSTDTWSTKRTNSRSTMETSMPDKLYASPVLRQQPEDPWAMEHVPCERQPAKTGDAKRVRRDKGTRQVVVTLRDDQFGQLIEAMSPPKHTRASDQSSQPPTAGAFAGRMTTQVPPVNMRGPAITRPSAAALARKGSQQDIRQKKPQKAFLDFETLPSAQIPAGPRLLSGFSQVDRIPTPHPFVLPQAQLNRWNSDVSMRDTSSILSEMSHRPQLKEGKTSPTPAPRASGSIRSKKEGTNTLTTPPPLDIRHNSSVPPEAGVVTNPKGALCNTPNATSSHADIDDIIDIDAVDEPFMPGHKGGESSIDSTGRLERKLYSALGEELTLQADADANAEVDPMAGIEIDETASGSNFLDLEIDLPLTKRKRQCTLKGETDRSPIAKMVRGPHDDKPRGSPDMPHLRGGR